MQDVRQLYTRYVKNVRFEYRRLAERGHHAKTGWMRNVNFQGAGVELPERVAPESALAITLATPVENLALVTRVAWAQPDVRNAPYPHGVRFTGVTPQKRDQLHTFIADAELLPVRVACALAATCHRKDRGWLAVSGTMEDVSERGVCIRLPEPVAPGTELAIRTATGIGPMVADAQVVWADRTRAGAPRGTSYRHGLRFLRVDPSSELPLRALLYGMR